MDATLYITDIQGRAFIALTGLMLACVIDMLATAFMSGKADPRPLLEQFFDSLTQGITSRLDRQGRGQGDLVMRGGAFTIVLVILTLALGYYALNVARGLNLSGVFLTILVGLSCGWIGWFGPLKALAAYLGNPKAQRPFLALARASYTNMVTLDDSGLIRVSTDTAIRSLLFRLAAPIVLFVLFGPYALMAYWPIMIISLTSGQSGLNRHFALVPNALARTLLFIPTLVLMPLVMAGLFFSGGASFFRAVPGLFKPTEWPDLLQGGPITLICAYAMKITLGGPRQNKSGRPVAVPWIGPAKASAKLQSRDIGRILYVQTVCGLFFGIGLYILSII